MLIVVDNMYDNDELAPPNIPPSLLGDMLLTYTEETPFVTPTEQFNVQQD